MLHKNYIRPTAFEKLRMDAIRKAGCILSMIRSERGLAVPDRGCIEIHHLIDGNRRMGHWYTIVLREWYHNRVAPVGLSEQEAFELYGATIEHGSKAFLASHGLTDRDLWAESQRRMGMSVEWPASKVLPRRIA